MLQIIRVLVVFGVGAIIGDGVLTPAISVLSSIEGLYEVANVSQGRRALLAKMPHTNWPVRWTSCIDVCATHLPDTCVQSACLQIKVCVPARQGTVCLITKVSIKACHLTVKMSKNVLVCNKSDVPAGGIVGIALAIICLLFFIQRFGTRFVGMAFSPIILLWLICNAMIGIHNLQKYGAGVFRAFGPNHWFDYMLRNGKQGWKTLGGVVLCITGESGCHAPRQSCWVE